MSNKKIQLKDINSEDNVYPVTVADFIEGFEEKFKQLNQSDEERLQELENREDKDTIYDDSEIRGEITNIRNMLKNIEGGNGSYDDTELRGRIEVLEEKEDKDTIYDDTEIKSRIETLEGKEDYDDSEIRGLVNLLKDAVDGKVNVEVCDSQYDFDQILTKSNNTIYLIKGDQDVWASKDYVDELFDMVVDLRSRITRLESDTYGSTLNEEEEPSIE